MSIYHLWNAILHRMHGITLYQLGLLAVVVVVVGCVCLRGFGSRHHY